MERDVSVNVLHLRVADLAEEVLCVDLTISVLGLIFGLGDPMGILNMFPGVTFVTVDFIAQSTHVAAPVPPAGFSAIVHQVVVFTD